MLQFTKDPPTVLAELASWSPGEQSGIRVTTSQWQNGDPARLLDTIETYGTRLSDPILSDLLRSASGSFEQTNDPGSLANRLLALPSAADDFHTAHFALSWARESPEAALAWASSLADETLRQQAVEAVNAVASAPDPVPARSLAEELAQQARQGDMPDGQQFLALTAAERRQVLDAGLSALAKSPQSDPFASDPFANSSFESIGNRYPVEVAEWLTGTLTAETTPPLMGTLTAAASAWAGENPSAAAAWAATLPPGDARAWAAANVAGQWRLFDEAAAQAWIETLPPDERAIAMKAVPELQKSP
jgi:hypothetical protein